jgi:hypothetical protein
VSWRAAFGRGGRGCPNAFRAVRRFPVRVASGFAMACRVGWTVSGQIRPGRRCPKACPIVASMWTPDMTARTSDRDQACGRSGIEHGRRWSRRTVPDAGSGWVAEGSIRIAVLSGQGQDVQAAWLAVASWPGAWSDAGRWRCPPRGAAVRMGSRPIGWAVTLNWGCPADRTLERSAMSVIRPATVGCPQEELIGGDDVRASVRRPYPGGSGRPDGLLACPARHGEVFEVPTGRSRVWVRADERLRRGSLHATDRADGRGWRWVGQWVSASNFRLSALAGRPGLCSAAGSLRGPDRLAAGESLGMSCSGSASIKDSKDTSR